MTKTTKHHAEKHETAHVVGTKIGTRGRTFEGIVTKHFPMRVVIEIERTVYVPKYERFYKKKTRIHARIPQGMKVGVGDLVRVQECRPLSKIIHAMVVEKVRSAEHAGAKQ